MDATLKAFQSVLDTLDTLREKCPWDRKQTFQSLRPLTLEEVYELSDSLLQEDSEEIKKELGDVLLHIVFYAHIAREKQWFTFADVCNQLVEKLVRRHPHIYGDVVVENEEEVRKNWEQIKQDEGPKSVLSGVPASMPSLIKAERLQEKAAMVGFDWDNRTQVIAKVREEIDELEEMVNANEQDLLRIEDEFGDLLFSLVNFARFLGISPDTALERTNLKFKNRFEYIEEKVKEEGRKMKDLSLEDLDKYWNEAKRG